MSIDPVRDDQGFPKASCLCDVCGAQEIVAASHERTRGNGPKVNEGQVVKKLTQRGWSYVRKKLRCPSCEEKRRAYEQEKSKHTLANRKWEVGGENYLAPNEVIMGENVTPIRKPTREQKREIIAMLDMAYDVAAGRYRGKDTDATIAENLSGGIMPGWVAEIREDLYGPDGGNDEIEKVIADLAAWREEMAKMAQDMHNTIAETGKALRDFNEGRGKAEEFLKRIEAIKAAVGPKAARA